MNPMWLSLILLAIQDAPAVASAIQLAQLPPLSDEQMAQLQAAMHAAVARLDADIAKKFPEPA